MVRPFDSVCDSRVRVGFSLPLGSRRSSVEVQLELSWAKQKPAAAIVSASVRVHTACFMEGRIFPAVSASGKCEEVLGAIVGPLPVLSNYTRIWRTLPWWHANDAG